MMSMKEKTYKSIENNLSHIAVVRRILIVKYGEDEETVDKFIAEVGASEVERTQNMNEMEIAFEMMFQMMKCKNNMEEMRE